MYQCAPPPSAARTGKRREQSLSHVEEPVAAADELDVTAIGFSPRPRTRLRQLLGENTSYRLILEGHHPAVAFPKGASDWWGHARKKTDLTPHGFQLPGGFHMPYGCHTQP